MIKIQATLKRIKSYSNTCAFFLKPESKHLIDEGKLKAGQEYELRIIIKRKK